MHETVHLDWDLIDARCAELGAITGTQRADLLGAGRAQLYRWRDGCNDIGLNRAANIAARLRLTLHDIVVKKPSPPPTGPRPPAGPPAPRPPAGPPKGDQ